MVDEFYGRLPPMMPDKFGPEGEMPPQYTELTQVGKRDVRW